MSDSGKVFDRAAVVVLARDALKAAVSGDYTDAAVAVQQLAVKHGSGAVLFAMMAWCDAVALKFGCAAGEVSTLVFIAEDGTVLTSDDVDPVVRWAGQFMAARSRMDHPVCDALIAALPTDGDGEYVWSVLVHAAAGLREFTR